MVKGCWLVAMKCALECKDERLVYISTQMTQKRLSVSESDFQSMIVRVALTYRDSATLSSFHLITALAHTLLMCAWSDSRRVVKLNVL